MPRLYAGHLTPRKLNQYMSVNKKVCIKKTHSLKIIFLKAVIHYIWLQDISFAFPPHEEPEFPLFQLVFLTSYGLYLRPLRLSERQRSSFRDDFTALCFSFGQLANSPSRMRHHNYRDNSSVTVLPADPFEFFARSVIFQSREETGRSSRSYPQPAVVHMLILKSSVFSICTVKKKTLMETLAMFTMF